MSKNNRSFKNYFFSFLSLIILFSFFINVNAALTYPSGTPTGETPGGKIMYELGLLKTKISKMLAGCSSGKYVTGFMSNGDPICSVAVLPPVGPVAPTPIVPGIVNGVCDNTNYGSCSDGTLSWIDNSTTCGTNQTWTCKGSGGGTNSTTCSKANLSCLVIPIPEVAVPNRKIATTEFFIKNLDKKGVEQNFGVNNVNAYMKVTVPEVCIDGLCNLTLNVRSFANPLLVVESRVITNYTQDGNLGKWTSSYNKTGNINGNDTEDALEVGYKDDGTYAYMRLYDDYNETLKIENNPNEWVLRDRLKGYYYELILNTPSFEPKPAPVLANCSPAVTTYGKTDSIYTVPSKCFDKVCTIRAVLLSQKDHSAVIDTKVYQYTQSKSTGKWGSSYQSKGFFNNDANSNNVIAPRQLLSDGVSYGLLLRDDYKPQYFFDEFTIIDNTNTYDWKIDICD